MNGANGRKCVKLNCPQKRPAFRRVRMGREPPRLKLLDFGGPAKPTVAVRIMERGGGAGLERDERRLVEKRVDTELNVALKMANDERVAKYGTCDMQRIHEKLRNVERARVVSVREKRMKAPVCPVKTKVVSPHQLIKEFLRNSPVQIIRPKKTVAELAAEELPVPPKLPVVPKGSVYDRIAKKAGMPKPKQTKVVKEKPPIPLYDKTRCSKKTSNKPYTVSELRRMAKAMRIPKSKIDEAKSSVKKLCDLVENKKPNAPNGSKAHGENESMKRRIAHAKAVLQKNKSTPPKSTPPENKLKQMGFNMQRIGRKSKSNPDPHTHNNLMKIARELRIDVPTTSKKPKPTATQLIELIKKKLGKA